MSGTSNVEFWLRSHGIDPAETLVTAILRAAKSGRHVLTENELMNIVREQSGDFGAEKDHGDDKRADRVGQHGTSASPADRYWGAQTQRRCENFKIGDQRFGRRSFAPSAS